MMKNSYVVPIDLCKYAMCNRGSTRYVKLYIYLKMFCSGHFVLTSTVKENICKDLNIHNKTLSRNLNTLLKKNGLRIIQNLEIIELLV